MKRRQIIQSSSLFASSVLASALIPSLRTMASTNNKIQDANSTFQLKQLQQSPNIRYYIELDGIQKKLIKSITNFSKLQNNTFTIEVDIVEGDMDFSNWILGNSKSVSKKNGVLQGYNSEDREIMRWNISNSWLKSYQISELSVESRETAVEIFEIACEKIDRVK